MNDEEEAMDRSTANGPSTKRSNKKEGGREGKTASSIESGIQSEDIIPLILPVVLIHYKIIPPQSIRILKNPLLEYLLISSLDHAEE